MIEKERFGESILCCILPVCCQYSYACEVNETVPVESHNVIAIHTSLQMILYVTHEIITQL